MKYLIILLPILLSCTKNEHHLDEQSAIDVETIEIDLSSNIDIKMSEYFDGIKYIQLQTGERKIGRTEKLIITDKIIGLFDVSNNSIWLFDRDGVFLNEISIPNGRGPQELEHVSDVLITNNNEVHFLGFFKIVVFDLAGNFLRDIYFDFFIYQFDYDFTTNEYIGYAQNSMNVGRVSDIHEGRDLIYFNEEGKISKSLFPIGKGKEHIGFHIPNRFPKYDNKTFFFPHLVDTLFTIYNGKSTPVYKLDFLKNTIPKQVFNNRQKYSESISDWAEFMEKELEGKGYPLYLSNLNITDDFIQLRVSTGTKSYMIFYDKMEKSTRVGNNKLINDLDFGPSPFFYETKDNNFYSFMEANDFLRHMNNLYNNDYDKYSNSKAKELRNISQSLTNNDNPILMILEGK